MRPLFLDFFLFYCVIYYYAIIALTYFSYFGKCCGMDFLADSYILTLLVFVLPLSFEEYLYLIKGSRPADNKIHAGYPDIGEYR